MKEIIVKSNIKGYHVFKIKPSLETGLFVEKENDNPYDPEAMVVKLPQEEEDGKVIGRVPANLCKSFRCMMKQGYTAEIKCFAVGPPTSSKKPDLNQTYKRNYKNGLDRRGGGAVIRCKFIIMCYESNYDKTVEYIREELLRIKGTEEIFSSKSGGSVDTPWFSCPW